MVPMESDSSDGEPARVQPHSDEAERSVLGALLRDNSAWDRVAELIHDGDFFDNTHRQIFAAIMHLVEASRPADANSVYQSLKAEAVDEPGAGMDYLLKLKSDMPSAISARRYAEIVRELADLRRLISTAGAVRDIALNAGEQSLSEVLDEAELEIFRTNERGSRQRPREIASVVVELLDRVTTLHESGAKHATGVPTGFHDLDRMTGGLQKGDLIVLAAYPSMGKSTLALNIAQHIALDVGLPVLFFSMEIGAAQMALRLVSSVGRIAQSRLRTGALREDDWPRLMEAVNKLSSASFLVDETPALSTAELRFRAQRMRQQPGGIVGLVVIDYIQLMHDSPVCDPNRAVESREFASSLKKLATELHCPVIAVSQLREVADTGENRRPLLSDLPDSGAIEQVADMIMFLYRDGFGADAHSNSRDVELIVCKQRNGPEGTVKFESLSRTKFEAQW
jgi:replicative DNA helicase